MKEIISTDFAQEVEQSTGYVLVDFAAQWCPPCRAMIPILEEVEKEFEGKLKFFKLDIDKSGDIAENLSVTSIPTLILFKGGEQCAVLVGAQSKTQIVQWLNSSIGG